MALSFKGPRGAKRARQTVAVCLALNCFTGRSPGAALKRKGDAV